MHMLNMCNKQKTNQLQADPYCALLAAGAFKHFQSATTCNDHGRALMECFKGCFAEPVLPLNDALLSLEAFGSALGSEGSKAGILEGRDVLAVKKE